MVSTDGSLPLAPRSSGAITPLNPPQEKKTVSPAVTAPPAETNIPQSKTTASYARSAMVWLKITDKVLEGGLTWAEAQKLGISKEFFDELLDTGGVEGGKTNGTATKEEIMAALKLILASDVLQALMGNGKTADEVAKAIVEDFKTCKSVKWVACEAAVDELINKYSDLYDKDKKSEGIKIHDWLEKGCNSNLKEAAGRIVGRLLGGKPIDANSRLNKVQFASLLYALAIAKHSKQADVYVLGDGVAKAGSLEGDDVLAWVTAGSSKEVKKKEEGAKTEDSDKSEKPKTEIDSFIADYIDQEALKNKDEKGNQIVRLKDSAKKSEAVNKLKDLFNEQLGKLTSTDKDIRETAKNDLQRLLGLSVKIAGSKQISELIKLVIEKGNGPDAKNKEFGEFSLSFMQLGLSSLHDKIQAAQVAVENGEEDSKKRYEEEFREMVKQISGVGQYAASIKPPNDLDVTEAGESFFIPKGQIGGLLVSIFNGLLKLKLMSAEELGELAGSTGKLIQNLSEEQLHDLVVQLNFRANQLYDGSADQKDKRQDIEKALLIVQTEQGLFDRWATKSGKDKIEYNKQEQEEKDKNIGKKGEKEEDKTPKTKANKANVFVTKQQLEKQRTEMENVLGKIKKKNETAASPPPPPTTDLSRDPNTSSDDLKKTEKIGEAASQKTKVTVDPRIASLLPKGIQTLTIRTKGDIKGIKNTIPQAQKEAFNTACRYYVDSLSISDENLKKSILDLFR